MLNTLLKCPPPEKLTVMLKADADIDCTGLTGCLTEYCDVDLDLGGNSLTNLPTAVLAPENGLVHNLTITGSGRIQLLESTSQFIVTGEDAAGNRVKPGSLSIVSDDVFAGNNMIITASMGGSLSIGNENYQGSETVAYLYSPGYSVSKILNSEVTQNQIIVHVTRIYGQNEKTFPVLNNPLFQEIALNGAGKIIYDQGVLPTGSNYSLMGNSGPYPVPQGDLQIQSLPTDSVFTFYGLIVVFV